MTASEVSTTMGYNDANGCKPGPEKGNSGPGRALYTEMCPLENEKKKKKTRGRQKIEIKKIDKKSRLQVTFSKRRTGLFGKANELGKLCGADIALLVQSPAGKVFSFGNPCVESVLHRFLRVGDSERLLIDGSWDGLGVEELEEIRDSIDVLSAEVFQRLEKITTSFHCCPSAELQIDDDQLDTTPFPVFPQTSLQIDDVAVLMMWIHQPRFRAATLFGDTDGFTPLSNGLNSSHLYRLCHAYLLFIMLP